MPLLLFQFVVHYFFSKWIKNCNSSFIYLIWILIHRSQLVLLSKIFKVHEYELEYTSNKNNHKESKKWLVTFKRETIYRSNCYTTFFWKISTPTSGAKLPWSFLDIIGVFSLFLVGFYLKSKTQIVVSLVVI